MGHNVSDTIQHNNKVKTNFLIMSGKDNKRKYLEAYLRKLHQLSPLIVSGDGLFGVKEEAT